MIAGAIFINELTKHKDDVVAFDFDKHKRIPFWGVKMLGKREGSETPEFAGNTFHLCSYVLDLIGKLTPNQLMTMFPIKKIYDGEKYGLKDYFYTMNVCREHGLDTPIGNAFEFLWDYENWDIRHFMVRCMSVMSDIRQFDGKPGIFEEFAAQHGLKLFKKKEINGSRVFIEELTITEDGKVL